MEHRYYTPSIEDIRVGYEYEAYFHNKWTKAIVEKNDNLRSYNELCDSTRIRTPYLTLEQIEAIGWIYNGKKGGFDSFYIGNINTNYYQLRMINNTIEIQDYGMINPDRNSSMYFGDCPSVNELRHICILLKINLEN